MTEGTATISPERVRSPAERTRDEIVFEGAVPASALPGDRPPLASSLGPAPLDSHPRLVDGPCCHRPLSSRILCDHRLQNDERETRCPIGFQLLEIERELPRSLADRVRKRVTQVPGAEIYPVGVPDVVREVARKLAPEALEVTLESLAHRGPCARLPRVQWLEVEVPTGRRRPLEEGRPPLRPPTACGGCNPPWAR